jgi:hypothetical protein
MAQVGRNLWPVDILYNVVGVLDKCIYFILFVSYFLQKVKFKNRKF